MESHPNYTLVGAFVIILFSAIVLAIIWLSSGFTSESYKTYKVYMQEAVSGLNLGAPVEYNGVNVGTVDSIHINHKNPQLVELLLKIKSDTPITQGTRAKLNARVLSGVAYILLEDKGTDMRPLVAEKGQDYPVINTAPSFFLQLDKAINQLSTSLSQVSRSISALLDKENLATIRSTLIHLDKITENFANNSQRMNEIFYNTAKTTQILQSQTLPDVNQFLINLNNATRNLNEVTGEIKNNPSILIRGKAPGVLGPGER